MRLIGIGIVALVTFTFAVNQLEAQGKVVWKKDKDGIPISPSPGKNAGEIMVEGIVLPDAGWEVIAGDYPGSIIPVGGGEKVVGPVKVAADGTFSTSLGPGLNSNIEYWVIIDGVVQKKCTTMKKVVSSDPGKTKPK